jgi:protein-L-isoaspartate(D-aspartate) O-methyltransferase
VTAATAVRRGALVAYLRREGITEERVLAAFAAVPRETFVPPVLFPRAYDDYALEIGEGQTISQPSLVARITELAAVATTDRVLEIGAGSGYQAAILAELARFVFALERIAKLAEGARARLAGLGYRNVSVQVMDGSLGWRTQAPFDAIIVSAGAPSIPKALTAQLAEGGRLIIPVGGLRRQELVRVVRRGDSFAESRHGAVAFVPLVGRDGHPEHA